MRRAIFGLLLALAIVAPAATASAHAASGGNPPASAHPGACLWHTLTGSSHTYTDPGGEGSGIERLTLAVQVSCDGSRARTQLTIQAEADGHSAYRGPVALAICTAHATGALAYCDPALAVASYALRMAPGQRVTLDGPAGYIAPQQRPDAPCDLSWGVPLGAATLDTVTLVWRWQTRAVCAAT